MDDPTPLDTMQTTAATLISGVAALVPDMQNRAESLDRDRRLPVEEMASLREIGALRAALPRRLGGLGLGTEPEGGDTLLTLLRLIGRGNLSVGRLFEGHVNAVALVAAYATGAQLRAVADAVAAGHLFAIWNTETGDGVALTGPPGRGVLNGAKQFCSGIGLVSRAVVTARTDNGDILLAVASLDRNYRSEPMAIVMQGMRAALVGRVIFEEAIPDAVFGNPGDYLRQPFFSAGAWRTSAVTLGGLDALLIEVGRQLRTRGRADCPHQKTRFGEMLIARGTAELWVRQAAGIAETWMRRAEAETVADVNLARIAVETAVLEVIRLTQRSLGLAALSSPNPVERLMRDLATYIRQPAADEALS